MNTSKSEQDVFSLLKPYRVNLIISTGLAIASALLGLIPFAIVYQIVRLLLNPLEELSGAGNLVLITFAAIIGQWLLAGISTTLSHRVAYRVLYDIRVQLAEKFGVLPLGYFNRKTTGELNKIFGEDVEILEVFIAHGIPECTAIAATLVFASIYLFWIDWRMGLATLSGIPLAILAQYLVFRNIQPILAGYYAVQDCTNATVIEYVRGMPVIKAFDQTTESYAKYKRTVQEYENYSVEWSKNVFFPWTLFTISLTVNLMAIAPLGVWLWQQGSLSLAQFVLFLILGVGLCLPLQKLMESGTFYIRTQEASKRVFNILNRTPLSQPAVSATPTDLTIEYRNIYFAYDTETVLEDISFTVPPKTITALVGASGSGKTTVARLLARFWEVQQGEVLLGGVNITNLRLEDLMAKTAFVFQDVVLFNDTVLENIRLGNPNASLEEVITAAKAAQCHQFIAALPQGYETIIGDRGAKLSGGEKQRIAIARAILKDAPIVILDEATAYIDPENEHLIQQAIAKLIQDKTLIVIAHRLSSIVAAQQIILLDRGRILAKGTHAELLNTSPLYTQMWQAHLTAQDWTFKEQVTNVSLG